MPSSPTGRVRVPELMDQPGLDPNEHEKALAGLSRINRISRSGAALWPSIAREVRASSTEKTPIRILDLASGGGDVPLAIAGRLARAGLVAEVEGCDVSQKAVEIARGRADAAGLDVRFSVRDVLVDPLPEGYDILTCSLFLHHLDEPEAVALFGRMAKAARRLLLVDDLARTRLGRLLAAAGCRLLTRSAVVRFDGPASVAAAFTTDEMAGLASRAGLVGATITRHWPERFLLAWKPS